MKFVLAPDKYKGSLTGQEFCDAVELGIRMVFPQAEIIKKPLADGGDGTLTVVKRYLNAGEVLASVNDPLFREITSAYLFSENRKVAFIEMSEASGHKLLQANELNCMHTTSVGTGELISDAIERGATDIILGIGGSATNDAGIGMATALGFRFLDKTKKVLKPVGSNLIHIKEIDTSHVAPILKNIKFKVACDVSNPLYGKNGAAYVYGPQKGASEEEVQQLDEGLKNFAEVVLSEFDIDVQEIKGAGAAGGFGAGAIVFLNAELTSGIELIKEMADFENAIKDVDWIITGEGKLDNQTLSGKTVKGVLDAAEKQNIPVAALCGSVVLTEEQQERLGLAYVRSISEGSRDLDEAIKNSKENLMNAANNFARFLRDKA